ncbi:MAG: AAA family ATPase [Planctomycetota bacterium]|jgi:MoxR-like ATPase
MSEKRSLQDAQAVEKLAQAKETMLREIHKVIIGQDEIVEQILITLFCRGHCLVVGVPGLAKTLLVQTISRVLHLKFSRIQFTPDLMPSDITGTTVLEEDVSTGKRSFRFVKGPLFGNIILADEINRTPPKTQAALLQAMQEYQVTAGGETFSLDLPFFVLATQNPIEQEGTYPLPEAQLDRFMLNLYIDYPTYDEEKAIIKATTYGELGEVKPVLSGQDILLVQAIVRRVPISDHVLDYAVRLARATRPAEESAPGFVGQYVSWGAGPRAAQNLVLGAKARAILSGRYSVTCNDVRALAHPVLRHRIFTNFNADAEGISPDNLVDLLLEAVSEPTAAEYA